MFFLDLDDIIEIIRLSLLITFTVYIVIYWKTFVKFFSF